MEHAAQQPPPRVIAFLGGKGGVGSTVLALNVGIELCRAGLRVVLLDATPRDASDELVLDRRVVPSEVLSDELPDGSCAVTPEGLILIHPPADRVEAWLTPERRGSITEQHTLLIDAGASAAGVELEPPEMAVLVSTPEPTSVLDAYGALKGQTRDDLRRVGVVINMARSRRAGRDAAARVVRTAREFLGREVEALGMVPDDAHVLRAVGERVPVVVRYPHCRASAAVRALSGLLATGRSSAPTVWERLAALFGA